MEDFDTSSHCGIPFAKIRVLSSIKGAKFEFNDDFQLQQKLPRVLKMSESESKFMDEKIREFLLDCSIKEVP